MNFGTILAKAFRDILSPPVLGFILKVGLGSFLFWAVALWLFWEPFEKFVASWISMIPFIGNQEWFQASGAFLAAMALGYALVVVTVSLGTSMWSEKLLLKLAVREYPELSPAGSAKIHRSVYHALKAGAVFLLLFILTIPFIFVPVLGQVWMLWLWSILLREPTTYDVGVLFARNETELRRLSKKTRMISLVAAAFNYIPLLNLFAPLFAQILFLHHVLSENREGNMRNGGK
jgi:uncharacterized protein involved in cysteine biosynthesis